MMRCEVSVRKPCNKNSATTHEKIVAAFSLTISKLGQVVDDKQSLSAEENRENVYAQNQLHRLIARPEEAKRWKMNVSELLSMRSPLYARQMKILQSFRIITLRQFLHSPISRVRARFEEEEVRFPLVLEILHSSYGKS